MNMQTIIGQKIEQTQEFLEDGTRIPVTRLWVRGNVVVGLKTSDKHNYSAIQLGFGQKKKASKAELSNFKGASLKQAPKFVKEVKANGESLSLGQEIKAEEILKPGDIVDVKGISKGKGFAGVVKRHHFRGGPRTHGQSDRERAPGSIGQTTTPGRVYKGKRMAGRMGHETVTVKNLEVVAVFENEIWVKGLVPGGRNSLVVLKKVGENKKFTPLFSSDAAPSVETTEAKKAMEDKKEGEENLVSGQPPVSGDAQASDSSRLSQASGDAQQSEEEQSDNSASLSEIQAPENDEKTDDKTEPNFSSPEAEQAPAGKAPESDSSERRPTPASPDVNENKKEDVEDAGK